MTNIKFFLGNNWCHEAIRNFELLEVGVDLSHRVKAVEDPWLLEMDQDASEELTCHHDDVRLVV